MLALTGRAVTVTGAPPTDCGLRSGRATQGRLGVYAAPPGALHACEYGSSPLSHPRHRASIAAGPAFRTLARLVAHAVRKALAGAVLHGLTASTCSSWVPSRARFEASDPSGRSKTSWPPEPHLRSRLATGRLLSRSQLRST